jgi:hypothetical protein
MLSRIAQHPVCERYPHIIQKLKSFSVDDIATRSDATDADDGDGTADCKPPRIADGPRVTIRPASPPFR